jgi:hypothetical protein
MDVLLYFNKSKETRMPQGPDSTGIRFEGPVLNGRISVESRRQHLDRIAMSHSDDSVPCPQYVSFSKPSRQVS